MRHAFITHKNELIDVGHKLEIRKRRRMKEAEFVFAENTTMTMVFVPIHTRTGRRADVSIRQTECTRERLLSIMKTAQTREWFDIQVHARLAATGRTLRHCLQVCVAQPTILHFVLAFKHTTHCRRRRLRGHLTTKQMSDRFPTASDQKKPFRPIMRITTVDITHKYTIGVVVVNHTKIYIVVACNGGGFGRRGRHLQCRKKLKSRPQIYLQLARFC